LSLVYGELRRLAAFKMANEAPGHTLQPTALVHEAWLRLAGSAAPPAQNRAHFFAVAAEAMRRILVESARRKQSLKRGGQAERVELEEIHIIQSPPSDEVLAVHEALDLLAAKDPVSAELVKLLYFARMTMDEAAAALGLSKRTAESRWTTPAPGCGGSLRTNAAQGLEPNAAISHQRTQEHKDENPHPAFGHLLPPSICLVGTCLCCVAQVSKPAVSPTSKSAPQPYGPAGLETRGTADLEVCATLNRYFPPCGEGRVRAALLCSLRSLVAIKK